MSDGNQTLKERFSDLSPAIRIGCVAGLVFILLLMFLIFKPASKSYKQPRANVDAPLVRADLLLPKPQDRTVEQMNGELIQQGRTIDSVKRSLERNNEEQRLVLSRLDEAMKTIQLGTGSGGVNEELVEQLRTLQDRMDQLESSNDLGSAGLPSPGIDEGMLLSEPAFPQVTEIEAPKIVIIGGDKSTANKAAAAPERVPYITANSMFEGQLLNGMDGPTDQSAKNTPVPAVIRIKSEAISPNLFNVPDIQECFVSVAGYGDMSDERVKMRTEILSCIVPSKTVV